MFRTLFAAAFAALTFVSTAFAQESINVQTEAGTYRLEADGLIVQMDASTPAYVWEHAPRHVRQVILDATIAREYRTQATIANIGKTPDLSVYKANVDNWATPLDYYIIFRLAKTQAKNTF